MERVVYARSPAGRARPNTSVTTALLARSALRLRPIVSDLTVDLLQRPEVAFVIGLVLSHGQRRGSAPTAVCEQPRGFQAF